MRVWTLETWMSLSEPLPNRFDLTVFIASAVEGVYNMQGEVYTSAIKLYEFDVRVDVIKCDKLNTQTDIQFLINDRAGKETAFDLNWDIVISDLCPGYHDPGPIVEIEWTNGQWSDISHQINSIYVATSDV